MNAPTTTMTGETSLTIRRTFAVDIETLFKALTQPEAIAQWFGPGGASVDRCEADLRVGGHWFIEMTSSGGEEHNVSGTYTEFDPPNSVSFTWSWYSTPDRVSLVTYRLSASGDGQTTLTLTHEKLADSDVRDRHAFGWNGALDKLEPWLAA